MLAEYKAVLDVLPVLCSESPYHTAWPPAASEMRCHMMQQRSLQVQHGLSKPRKLTAARLTHHQYACGMDNMYETHIHVPSFHMPRYSLQQPTYVAWKDRTEVI